MFSCFKKCNRAKIKYIYKHTNKFDIIGKLDKNYDNLECLDMKAILVWVCDSKLQIIHGTTDRDNDLKLEDYIGKNIFDVKPKDFGNYCGNLHEQAQKEKKIFHINLLLNNRLVHIIVKPLTYDNNVIGSSLFIIPFIRSKTIP